MPLGGEKRRAKSLELLKGPEDLTHELKKKKRIKERRRKGGSIIGAGSNEN